MDSKKGKGKSKKGVKEVKGMAPIGGGFSEEQMMHN